MRDILPEVERWRAEGQAVALATVVKTWGSAPRPLGAKMAVNPSGGILGSVSGGCVEAVVIEEAQGALEDGRARLLRIGVSDETAWSVGLSCGGEIEVFVEPLASAAEPRPEQTGVGELPSEQASRLHREVVAAVRGEETVALAMVVAGPGTGRRLLIWPAGEVSGDLGSPRLNQRVSLFAQQVFAAGSPCRKAFSADGGAGGPEADVFFDLYRPPDKLVIVGAVHAAIPLVAIARVLGMKTIVVDPRTAFATRERFPDADELITEWPDMALSEIRLDGSTAVVSLSHDVKLDLPALAAALRSPAGYIGALGSSRTHAKRLAALAADGFAESDLGRIHAPIGLDLGGRRAEEIAVAVAAEIVAVRNGKGRDRRR